LAQQDTKKVDSKSKPLQLSLSLVKCNTEISLLACVESKFYKNVQKNKNVKKRKKNVTRIKKRKKRFFTSMSSTAILKRIFHV